MRLLKSGILSMATYGFGVTCYYRSLEVDWGPLLLDLVLRQLYYTDYWALLFTWAVLWWTLLRIDSLKMANQRLSEKLASQEHNVAAGYPKYTMGGLE